MFPSLSPLIVLATIFTFSNATPLASRQTQCRGVTVLFARGTTETGTLGTVVGPGLSTAVAVALPGRTSSFTGVPYPATVAGFLAGGDEGGARTMAQLAEQAVAACPNEKIVMSFANSQGAQVARKAVNRLSAAAKARLGAIVLFGDPNNGDPFGGGLDAIERTFCNIGDLICAGQAIILAPHLTTLLT